MKILLIHTRYQMSGGEDTVIEQELKLLRQHHTVEIMFFQNHKGGKGAIQFFASIWNVSCAKKVKHKISKFQPDLVHIHNWHFALGPLVFREIHAFNIPVVHTVHNYRLLCPSGILLNKGELFLDSLNQCFPFTAVFNKVYRSSYLQTFWLAFIVWFHKKIGTWEKIDLYLCLTQFTVEIFEKSNFRVSKEHFIVKPNFTDFVTKINIEKESHFLFVGRLSEEKGIRILLEAFLDTPYLLKIAGEGPLKQVVLNSVKQSPNIYYLGSLTKEEVNFELNKAQALIFPSIWYETFGLVITESFSNSTPVLSSDIGAPKSIVINDYNGYQFECGNVEKLREMIRKYAELPKEIKDELGRNAKNDYNRKYASDLQIGYFNSIYMQLLKNKYKND